MANSSSNALRDWAVNEMGYTGQWGEDMALLCTGPMAGVWEWVVAHCKSKENVKIIQGNLALAKRRQGVDLSMNVTMASNCSGNDVLVDREELLAERGRLIGDLHSVLAKIERLRGVVEQHNKDRLQLAGTKEERANEVKQKQQRTMLLGLYVKQVSNFINKLDDLASRLEKLATRVNDKEAKGEKMFSNGVGVETESTKNIREAVGLGVEHMKVALVEKGGNSRRGQVRDSILQLLGGIPAAVIVNCLVDQAIDQTHQVKKKTDSVDLVKEAADLQKKEGDNEFLSSVRNEVAQFVKRHVTSKLTATNLAESIASWEERANLAREKLGGRGEVSGEEEEKARLKGMVASYKSSIDSIKSSLDGMESSGNRHPLLDTVKTQQEQIEELAHVISVLISSSFTSNFVSHQSSTLDTMNNTIPQLAAQISTLSKSLMDSPSSQLATLGSCPTGNLTSTLVGGVNCSTLTPTNQLLIHRMKSKLPKVWEGTCVQEDTVSRIIKLILEVDSKERELEHSKLSQVTSLDKEELGKLERSLASSIREQGRNLGPVIEEGEGLVLEAREVAEKVDQIHSTWSRQPSIEVAVGGSLVWGDVDGRGLQQWVDLVRVNLAKLYSNNS